MWAIFAASHNFKWILLHFPYREIPALDSWWLIEKCIETTENSSGPSVWSCRAYSVYSHEWNFQQVNYSFRKFSLCNLRIELIGTCWCFYYVSVFSLTFLIAKHALLDSWYLNVGQTGCGEEFLDQLEFETLKFPATGNALHFVAIALKSNRICHRLFTHSLINLSGYLSCMVKLCPTHAVHIFFWMNFFVVFLEIYCHCTAYAS